MSKSTTDSINSVLRVGDKAPDFVLTTEKGKKWRLSEQFGKVTALLFYPKSETLVCNRQMCSVRDNWADYLKAKANVIGISSGTIEELLNFSQRHRLPVTLLADAGREITKIYCKYWLPVQLTRAVVIIDARGIIRQRQIMLRVFRPPDKSILTSIHAARTEFMYEHYHHILNESREKNKHLLQ